MSLSTASKIVDFVFKNVKQEDKVDIGFFGGEPFFEFDLIKNITDLIQTNASLRTGQTKLSVTTNGTILTDEIIRYLGEDHISLCISCDGPPEVQDRFRHFPDGSKTSTLVEKNLRRALRSTPSTAVNAVYSPETLESLPRVVDYFLSLGVRIVYLSPNISARWGKKEADMLPAIYDAIGKKYLASNSAGKAVYISLIDSKIALMLRGGYKPIDRCRMGKGEYAFAPSGNLYPCERLIGSDDGKTHCLGNISDKLSFNRACQGLSSSAINVECIQCSLKEYCMNWCGCSNYYSTGSYNVVSPFTCASEKAAIKVAFDMIRKMKNNWLPSFPHNLVENPDWQ